MTTADILAALDDLGATTNTHGIIVPLPHTRREDGTIDTIEVGPYNPTTDWMIYTGRHFLGRINMGGSVTGTVARCPGWMVVLVVRALREMRGGETFVPKVGAAPILYLARAIVERDGGRLERHRSRRRRDQQREYGHGY